MSVKHDHVSLFISSSPPFLPELNLIPLINLFKLFTMQLPTVTYLTLFTFLPVGLGHVVQQRAEDEALAPVCGRGAQVTSGTPLSSFKGALNECARTCDDDHGCNTYEFSASKSYCYLYQKELKNLQTRASSEYKVYAVTCPIANARCGIKGYLGQDLRPIDKKPGLSVGNCKSACLNNDRCRSFEHGPYRRSTICNLLDEDINSFGKKIKSGNTYTFYDRDCKV